MAPGPSPSHGTEHPALLATSPEVRHPSRALGRLVDGNHGWQVGSIPKSAFSPPSLPPVVLPTQKQRGLEQRGEAVLPEASPAPNSAHGSPSPFCWRLRGSALFIPKAKGSGADSSPPRRANARSRCCRAM